MRPIDVDALKEKFEDILDRTYTDDYAKGFVAGLYTALNMPTLTPPNEPLTLEFDVVDTTTGKYPDWERIAREESWAKGLVYCDMDGIAIREDGSLILLDECGNCVSCPPDRFEIRRRPPEGEA